MQHQTIATVIMASQLLNIGFYIECITDSQSFSRQFAPKSTFFGYRFYTILALDKYVRCTPFRIPFVGKPSRIIRYKVVSVDKFPLFDLLQVG